MLVRHWTFNPAKRGFDSRRPYQFKKENHMSGYVKDKLTKACAIGGLGAATGAVGYKTIGGMGLAFLGRAVGITLGPWMAIGTGVALAGYGLYRLGCETLFEEEED